MRNRIVGMVLATDLSVNFPTINAFKQMVSDKSHELERALDTAESRTAAASAAAAATALAAHPGIAAESSQAAPLSPSAAAAPERKTATFSITPPRESSRVITPPRESSRKSRASSRHGGAEPSSEAASFGRSVGGSRGRRTSMKLREQIAHCEARQRLEQWQLAGLSLNPTEELLILKLVLKVADIGNVTKGKGYCLGWTERVVAEFFAQGDLEAQLQLPVTPFMDRASACVPKQQVGFYNFVARPMIEALDGLVSMSGPLANLQQMQDYWIAKFPPDTEVPGQPGAAK